MLESNQRLAIIDRGLDLRANPAWCAVRELNPHLLGVGQLFSSVELPAQKFGSGCKRRTCLAALIWRRSGYKPLPLPEAPPLVARDGFEPSTTALWSRVLPTELASPVLNLAGRAGLEPAHGVSNSHVPFQLDYRPRKHPQKPKGPDNCRSLREFESELSSAMDRPIPKVERD